MTTVNPREYQERRGRSWAAKAEAQTLQATTTDAKVRKLYGARGETLRTFSDRPPIGFHSALEHRP